MFSKDAKNNGTKLVLDYYEKNCLGNTTCKIDKAFFANFRDYLTPACQKNYDQRKKEKGMLQILLFAPCIAKDV